MKALLEFLHNAWDNKHTSTSALLLFAATTVGIIWPKHKDKADEIARVAMVYGLITAGDARASLSRTEKTNNEKTNPTSS